MHSKQSKIRRWALYVFFFSINFEVWDPLNTDGSFSISKFTGLIYFASIINNIRQFISFDGLKSYLFPIWLFFGLLTIVSYFNINDASSSFFYSSIFQNIIIFWLLLNHERMEENIIEKGLLSFAIGSIALAALYYFGVGIEYTQGRVSIFGDNVNIVGMRMSISSTVLLLMSIQNRLNFSKWRFMLIIPIPIMLLLMEKTGSRVAFLSFALSFVAGTLLLRTKAPGQKLLVLLLALVIAICGWKYLEHAETLKDRILLSFEERDLSSREKIWSSLVPLIRGNPLLGVGRTGYVQYTENVYGYTRSPHNVLLEVLCYTGVTGLIVYLLFIFRIIESSYVAIHRNSLLLPVLLMIPVAGLILSAQILTSKIGWVIFAYVISAGRVPERNAQNRFRNYR